MSYGGSVDEEQMKDRRIKILKARLDKEEKRSEAKDVRIKELEAIVRELERQSVLDGKYTSELQRR